MQVRPGGATRSDQLWHRRVPHQETQDGTTVSAKLHPPGAFLRTHAPWKRSNQRVLTNSHVPATEQLAALSWRDYNKRSKNACSCMFTTAKPTADNHSAKKRTDCLPKTSKDTTVQQPSAPGNVPTVTYLYRVQPGDGLAECLSLLGVLHGAVQTCRSNAQSLS